MYVSSYFIAHQVQHSRRSSYFGELYLLTRFTRSMRFSCRRWPLPSRDARRKQMTKRPCLNSNLQPNRSEGYEAVPTRPQGATTSFAALRHYSSTAFSVITATFEGLLLKYGTSGACTEVTIATAVLSTAIILQLLWGSCCLCTERRIATAVAFLSAKALELLLQEVYFETGSNHCSISSRFDKFPPQRFMMMPRCRQHTEM